MTDDMTDGAGILPVEAPGDAGAIVEIVLSRQGDGWLNTTECGALVATVSTATRGAILIRSADAAFARQTDGSPDVPGPAETGARDRAAIAALCHAVETARVPVAVWLAGPVSGAGAELALAAGLRLAAPEARIGFNAQRFGLISGAGSTQRLPRLVGGAEALAILTTGRMLPAAEALVLGLFDRVIEGADPDTRLVAARVALREMLAQGLPRRRAPAEGRGFLQAVAGARATAPGGSLAAALVDCVEAALLLPPDQGLAFEAAQAAERAALPEPAALIHLFRAERRAALLPPALQGLEVAPVRNPAFLGAAPQFAGLALAALSRGLPVAVVEGARDRLVPMLEAVAARQEAAVQAGSLSPAQRDADWSRLMAGTDPDLLSTADLVLLAPEAEPAPSLALRRRGVPVLLLGRGALPEGAFRLTLTGRVAELALPRPTQGPPAVQAVGFLRRLGLTVILTGQQSPLGLAGRLSGAGGTAVRALLRMGVAPGQIIAALAGFGVPAAALPDMPETPPRAMAPDEIRNRWLGALANEGARLLAAGMAQHAQDIDLLAVRGLGFPRESGGPLHQADRRGLLILRRDLRLWAEDDPVWAPVPALDALVSLGRGFAGGLSPG